ncbi:hypothetical protein C8Q74DRAFT_104480 [Fomes fomentarius]|nr:hypothetical protein C8Q74DRAFT_104480 [Fomes fomentarius]
MINHPQLYLNGTVPLNVTGAIHACVFKEGESTGNATSTRTLLEPIKIASSGSTSCTRGRRSGRLSCPEDTCWTEPKLPL